jgi:hypothetical protein
MAPTTASANEVILEGPDQYHTWLSAIKGSVPRDLWKYFDPDTASELLEPEPVTFEMIRPGATSIATLNTNERSQYTSLRSVYNYDMTQFQRLLSEEAKLRNKIMSTVSETKKPQLQADKPVRMWLANLQTSTKPTDAQMKDITRARHRTLMGAKYVDWPSGGPDKWLTEWQKLMADCELWCPALHTDWASDFNLVWGEVSGAKRLCDRLVEAITNEEIGEWDIYRASRELKQAWDQKSIRSGMKVAGRGRVTRAAFAMEPRFDGTGPEGPDSTLSEQEQATPTTAESSRARSASRKRAGTETNQKEGMKRGQKKTKKPCWGCGGTHPFYHCVLITGHNPRDIQVSLECRRTFDNKMKDPSFAEKISTLREAQKIKRDMAAANDEA